MQYDYDEITERSQAIAAQVEAGTYLGSKVRSAIAHIAGCMVENLIDGGTSRHAIGALRIAGLTLDYLQAEHHQLIDSRNARFLTLEACEEVAEHVLALLGEDELALDAITHPYRIQHQFTQKRARANASDHFSEAVMALEPDQNPAIAARVIVTDEYDEQGELYRGTYCGHMLKLQKEVEAMLQCISPIAKAWAWEEEEVKSWDRMLQMCSDLGNMGVSREAWKRLARLLADRVWPDGDLAFEIMGGGYVNRKAARVVCGVLVRAQRKYVSLGGGGSDRRLCFTISGPGYTTNGTGHMMRLGSKIRNFAERTYPGHRGGKSPRIAWRTNGIAANSQAWPVEWLKAWGVSVDSPRIFRLADLVEGSLFKIYRGELTEDGPLMRLSIRADGSLVKEEVKPNMGGGYWMKMAGYKAHRNEIVIIHPDHIEEGVTACLCEPCTLRREQRGGQ